jgi:hypothetical protein
VYKKRKFFKKTFFEGLLTRKVTEQALAYVEARNSR